MDVTPALGDAIEYRAPLQGHLDRPALLGAVVPADALISLLSDRVDRELLDAGPRLRVVANFAVGYDNVDVAEATRRGVVVTNTPDVLTEATADFAFALLLAAARRLIEGHHLVASGAWQGWAPGQLLGADVFGRTLGIIGLGRIGQAVARRAAGFSMDIIYTGRGPVAGARALGARFVDVDTLLAESDFVTLHCPLTDDTRDIIGPSALAAMKPTAVLVNTARGGCVDELALAEALETGEIGAAGLDVFAKEPAVTPRLRACDRLVLAPHAGSATTTARLRMAQICVNAVRSVLEGRRPATPVNPEVWPEVWPEDRA